MPEYSSSGIWSNEPSGPFRHSMLEHSELKMDAELSGRFNAWITKYWMILTNPETFDVDSFNDEGRKLATELKHRLGDATEVRFVPLKKDGRLADEEVISV